MTVMVALLRGINVGGAARLPMADLRSIVERCGYDDVRTYIQSGNVVLSADSPPDDVAARLATAIADDVGFAPAVTVRTGDELRAIVEACPYVDRTDDPTKLHIGFATEPLPAVGMLADPAAFLPEEFTVVDRQIYFYLPFGMGRSPLTTEFGKHKGGPPTTIRNWRTVTKLLELVSDVEG